MHPHRQVLDQPDSHPGPAQRGLRATNLPGEQPLHPAVQVHDVGVARAEGRDGIAARVAEPGRPLVPRQPVLLGQGAPRRV